MHNTSIGAVKICCTDTATMRKKEMIMMAEMVSAVITTCKRDKTIVRRAIESVLKQTYPNIEIVVVDDSPSSFEGRESVSEMVRHIGQEAPQKVRYIQHETCLGTNAARNTGIKNSSGEFIGFLDDDDEWLSEKIEKQVKLMEKLKVSLVYCSAFMKNDTTGELPHGNGCEYRGWIYPDLIMGNFIGSTSFPLLKKRDVIEVGCFDENMQSAQDYDLWLRLFKQFECDYINEELGIYHIYKGEQITKNPKKKIAGLRRLNEKNMEYLMQNKKAHWYRTIKIAPFYAQDGQFRKGISTWLETVRLCPFEMKVNIKYFGNIFLDYCFFLKNNLKLAVDKARANVRGGGDTLSELSFLYAVTEGRCAYAC